MFPKPTAEPTQAITNPIELEKLPFLCTRVLPAPLLFFDDTKAPPLDFFGIFSYKNIAMLKKSHALALQWFKF